MPTSPSPEEIFGNTDEEILRQSASRLLANYSNPWDPIAEGAQNSVDAINKKYRKLLADRLGTNYETLHNEIIEEATKHVVEIDAESFKEVSYSYDFEQMDREGLPEEAKWGDSEYREWIHDRYYEKIGDKVGMSASDVQSIDEEVRNQYQGEITIERDSQNRRITIHDNGIGMSPNELSRALKRYGSLKSGTGGSSLIGELGNGLTYLLANCNEFYITSSDGSQQTEAKVTGMLDWVRGSSDIDDIGHEIREVDKEEEEYRGDNSFTYIDMSGVRRGESEYPDLFSDEISTDRVSYLIRNKTAVGQIFDALKYPARNTLREEDVTVTYTEIDSSDEEERVLPFSYQGPAQVARVAGDQSASKFPQQLPLSEAKERVDDQSRNIGEKSVVAQGVWQSPGGVKHYYEAFVASRDRYRGLSREYGYCDDPEGRVGKTTFDLTPGIEIGVKGMPCGIRIDTPTSGSAGYWGNLYIIIMNNSLTFDEGRAKPATGQRGKNFKDCAGHVLFREIGVDVISGTTKGSGISPRSSTDILDDRLEGKTDLPYECLKTISFRNEPTSEQDVVGIFHECLSQGIFPDTYSGLDTSTWHTYDEIYHYKVDFDDDIDLIGSQVVRGYEEQGETGIDEDIIVEFKREGSDIFSDLSTNKKIYSEIDLLICWDFDEDNETGVTLTEKEPDEVAYWGTTHSFQIDSHLLYDSSNNVDVIKLTDLFEMIDNGKYTVM